MMSSPFSNQSHAYQVPLAPATMSAKLAAAVEADPDSAFLSFRATQQLM